MIENTILVVDDEDFNLDLMEFSLEDLKEVRIIRANSAKNAFDVLSNEEVDLIILDISMPGMDGLEMLQILKSNDETKFIPVIMVTAKNEERHKSLEYGSEDFLTKPIDVIELKFKVNNLLKLKKFNDLQQFFNQKLEEEIIKKEKQLRKFAQVEQEINLAKSIQESIIPKKYPNVEKFDIYGLCTQAYKVGGDYFDVFQTNCEEYTICIMADVSGHGFSSALIAMQFRTLVRAKLCDGSKDFSILVEELNKMFTIDNNESSMFITALFLRLNNKSGEIESINAGHYNPLGNINMVHQSSIPIGIMPNVKFNVLKTPFKKGDTILLYTDGIVEGEDAKGRMYEEHFYKHYDAVKEFESKQQVEILLKKYHNYIEKQIDDVTILAIRSVL